MGKLMSENEKRIGSHLRFDARKWRGAEELSQKMEAEGFLVPTLQAELASDLSGGAFTADEFIAEGAEVTYFFMEMVYDHSLIERTPVPNRCRSILANILRNTDEDELRRRYWRPIEEQKLVEMRLLPEGNEELVLKRTEVRKFANKIAKNFGFRPVRKKRILFPSSVEKVLPRSALMAVMGIDGGGSNYDIPLGFDTLFCITNGPNNNVGLTTDAECLLRGMRLYENINGIDHFGPQRSEFLAYPNEHWSNIQKVGAYAVVRCFDLFLDSFDKAVVETNS